MKFLIFSKNPNEKSNLRIIREAKKRGHQITINTLPNLLVTSDFSGSFKVYEHYDLVHAFSGNKALVQIVNDIFLDFGLAVVNANSHKLGAYSKFSQMKLYSMHNILVPATIYTVAPEWNYLTTMLGEPFVVKPINGSKGVGVQLINSPAELNKIVKPSQSIFQTNINNDSDYRVHVFGGRACCMFRRIRKSGFVNNVSCGADTKSVQDMQERKILSVIAECVARVGGFDYVGVDIVRSLDDGKYYVLETNSAPGVYDVEIDSGEDYALKIVDLYENMVLNKH